ncbi:hypothetical protein DRP04_03350 [Archaeoglobales archaeon]|nr:MAG: hypothetical protein DRP04_03350 [Archaeoglobales archaeon]
MKRDKWELIGYSKTTGANGGGGAKVKEDLKNVPKWVQNVAFYQCLLPERTYYVKGKTFLYKIEVRLGCVQGYWDYYFYRKLRRRKS